MDYLAVPKAKCDFDEFERYLNIFHAVCAECVCIALMSLALKLWLAVEE